MRNTARAGYVVVQLGLLTAAAVVGPGSPASALALAVVVLGTLTFVAGVVRVRPSPRLGWNLLTLSALFTLGAALAGNVGDSLRVRTDVTEVVPATLGALGLALLAGGLAALGHFRDGAEDALDSAMLAMGGFVLLWAYVITPVLHASPLRITAAVVYPVAMLLVVTTAFKMILARGLRDPVLWRLLAAVVLLLISSAMIMIPAVRSDRFEVPRFAGLLWVSYGAVLGTVGLNPPLLGERRAIGRPQAALSPWRVALFVALTLVPPLAIVGHLIREELGTHGAVAELATLAASAMLLLLLVWRMVLMARVAERRAEELSQRTSALTASVADQKVLQLQLTYRATHDSLTGLANRSVLNERLEEVLRGGGGPHALLLLDLDGFKDVNDTLGHPVGDELLKGLADRLVGSVPAGALVVRLGGDEFAILLEKTDGVTARRTAQGVLEAMHEPFVVEGREQFLSASIGLLATDPARPPANPSEALRDADLALYAAKGSGKGRVVFFEPQLRSQRLDHARLSNGLRHALSHDELVLYYRPVIDVDTSRIGGVEALLRWHPPGATPVDSSEFLELAEETGLISPIGTWTLRRACHDGRHWYERHGIVVGLSIAARQLEDPGFTDTVLAALSDAGLPGDGLLLELTERDLMSSVRDEGLNIKLRRLRSRGVRIGITDFGAAFESLKYVAALPVDIVKLHRSFTDQRVGPAEAQQTRAFARAVLQLIEGLDVQASAEGIDTPRQMEALRALGLPYAQGDLFARPMSAGDIDRTLAEQVKAA
jgi:diguanylate cyclase (GGDEF)-like protein